GSGRVSSRLARGRPRVHGEARAGSYLPAERLLGVGVGYGGRARLGVAQSTTLGGHVRNVAASSANTVVKKPSIIFSSSASVIPGSAGNSPSRSTFVRSPSGVYEC